MRSHTSRMPKGEVPGAPSVWGAQKVNTRHPGHLPYTDTNDSTKNQTCNYTTDDLRRIASVNCGSSTWGQNFTYDPFGNITKTVPGGYSGTVYSPPPSRPLDPCANPALAGQGILARQQIQVAQLYIDGGVMSVNGTVLPAGVGALYGYYEAVHTNGPNDIKDQTGHSRSNQNDVSAGNISFGITCPFGAAFCQFAAGFAQSVLGDGPDFSGTLATGFDTPSDNAGIKIGQAMRAAGCHE